MPKTLLLRFLFASDQVLNHIAGGSELARLLAVLKPPLWVLGNEMLMVSAMPTA
jgi:hypothetical protein